MTEATRGFQGYHVRENRLHLNANSSDISGATASWWCEQSNKGPDVGRAVLGLLGGAILGAIIGFVIFGGIITTAVFAVVIGLVAGLKPVEHGKVHVVITYPGGRQADIPGPLSDWPAAQSLAGDIITAGAAHPA